MILLIWNTLYELYCLTRVIIAERVICCVVFAIVSLACSSHIYHRSLSSWGDMVEWRPFDWSALACGTVCTVTIVSDTHLDDTESTLTLPIIRHVMAPMSYIWSTESLPLYVLVRSGYPPSVITAPMFLAISFSTTWELLGEQTFCGSHSNTNEQVTCGNVCSSLYVDFLVATPSIFPL